MPSAARATDSDELTGGGASGGGALLAAGQLLTTPRPPEGQTQHQRWEELRNSGIASKREACTSDHVVFKERTAAYQEKVAREASRLAAAEKRAKELSTVTRRAQASAAEEAALRAEQQLAEAERAFAEWRSAAETSLKETATRCKTVEERTLSVLAEREKDAEARAQRGQERLDAERASVDEQVAQEKTKLARQLSIAEAGAGKRRAKAEGEVAKAQAEVAEATERMERERAMAEQREQRSQAIAHSKIQLALVRKEDVHTKTDLRVKQAYEEHALRVKQSRACEESARADRDARAQRGAAQIAAAEQRRDEVFADRKEADEKRVALHERVCADLAGRVQDWGARAESVKVEANGKVAEVRAIAEQLRRSLLEDLWATKTHVDTEVGRVARRAENDKGRVDAQVKEQQQLTQTVRELAEQRVGFVQHLAEQQARERGELAQESLHQAAEFLAETQRVAEGRAKEASEHLMGFLDYREAQGAWRTCSPQEIVWEQEVHAPTADGFQVLPPGSYVEPLKRQATNSSLGSNYW